jgi:hypothetical protein
MVLFRSELAVILTLIANETFVMFRLWNVACQIQYIILAFLHLMVDFHAVCFGMKPESCFRGALFC